MTLIYHKSKQNRQFHGLPVLGKRVLGHALFFDFLLSLSPVSALDFQRDENAAGEMDWQAWDKSAGF
jgi:hypothetical protein